MRRALVLSLLILGLAGSAGAQQKTKAAPLRGSLPAASAAPSRSGEEAEAPLSAVAALALSPPRPATPPALSSEDVRQCRLSCAQTYYFCLSRDENDGCSPNWGQCRAACDAPEVSRNLALGYPR